MLILRRTAKLFSRLIACSLLLALTFNIALATPNAAGSETGLVIPAGCNVIGGDYSTAGTEKCLADGLTGLSTCYLAKINCCGNGTINQDLYDANPPYGLIHAAESCEPSEPYCRNDCTKCGDSLIQNNHGEGCDKGPRNGTTASDCTGECKVPICGNGVREIENTHPVEICDATDYKPEDLNKVLKVCDNNCVLHYCGDGEVYGTEQCDGTTFKPADQGRKGLFCDAECKIHYCGDGVEDTQATCRAGNARCPEECDDHNTVNTDACTNVCSDPVCGDHIITPSIGEQCDGDAYCANCQCIGAQPAPGCPCGAYCAASNTCGQCVAWGCHGCPPPPQARCGDCDGGNGGCCGCFPYGVQITMADDTKKPIEEVQIGDNVKLANGGSAAVTHIIEGPEERPLVVFGAEGKRAQVTTQHIIPTAAGLKRAEDLKIGDIIRNAENKEVKVDFIDRPTAEEKPIVRNITLGKDNKSVEGHFLISDGFVTGDLYLQQSHKE